MRLVSRTAEVSLADNAFILFLLVTQSDVPDPKTWVGHLNALTELSTARHTVDGKPFGRLQAVTQ